MLNEQCVLVIGGAGYIGSHMVAHLKSRQIAVVVLDDLSSGHRDALAPDVPFYQGDLADHHQLNAILAKHNIGAVMHFAAFIEVAESVASPAKYYQNNVVKTTQLLDWMRDKSIKYFIFSSTAAVYGEPQSALIDETHPALPINPYGRSKLMVEQICYDYANAYDFHYIALRYFNASGAHPDGHLAERHDPETHLIPILLQAAMGLRSQFTIFGDDYPTEDGTCVRDFIHVMDLCSAHYKALHYLLQGGESQAFNVGTSEGYSVKQVVEQAKKVIEQEFKVEVAPRRAGDPSRLVADATKLKEICDWRPEFSDINTIIRDAYGSLTRL